MLSVQQIYTHSPLRNYTYVVYSDTSGEAICIDPFESKSVITFLRQKKLKLVSILNTHEHHDHVAGNLELKEETGAIVKAHPGAKEKIPGLDEVIKDNEIAFENDESKIIALETPGHTFCHHCYVLQTSKKTVALFSGDTLFNAGVGNCYRGGEPKVLFETIKNKLNQFPLEMKLYPGHDYWENNIKFAKEVDPKNHYLTEIENLIRTYHSETSPFVSEYGQELKINPFFRLREVMESNPEYFQNMPPDVLKSEENLFIYLRSVRDKW